MRPDRARSPGRTPVAGGESTHTGGAPSIECAPRNAAEPSPPRCTLQAHPWCHPPAPARERRRATAPPRSSTPLGSRVHGEVPDERGHRVRIEMEERRQPLEDLAERSVEVDDAEGVVRLRI